jgi:hypothetical protein
MAHYLIFGLPINYKTLTYEIKIKSILQLTLN